MSDDDPEDTSGVYPVSGKNNGARLSKYPVEVFCHDRTDPSSDIVMNLDHMMEMIYHMRNSLLLSMTDDRKKKTDYLKEYAAQFSEFCNFYDNYLKRGENLKI